MAAHRKAHRDDCSAFDITQTEATRFAQDRSAGRPMLSNLHYQCMTTPVVIITSLRKASEPQISWIVKKSNFTPPAVGVLLGMTVGISTG